MSAVTFLKLKWEYDKDHPPKWDQPLKLAVWFEVMEPLDGELDLKLDFIPSPGLNDDEDDDANNLCAAGTTYT